MLTVARRTRPQGMPSTGGGPANVPNLRVCKHLGDSGGTCRWKRANQRSAVVPSSRRGKNLQWVAQRGRTGLPARVSGRHVVRRWQFSPILECAQVTGKAGENGQYSGEMGGSSPWTRPSAPECRDTLKALAGRPALDLGWGSSSKTALGSLSTGSPAGPTPLHGDGSMYSQAYVRINGPSVAVRDRGHWKGVCGKRVLDGWKGGRPWVRSPKTISVLEMKQKTWRVRNIPTLYSIEERYRNFQRRSMKQE